MGVFPEDEKIDVLLLTYLWIAEGFLKPNKNQTLEEVAEGCLNDLIGRNLINLADDDGCLKRKSEECEIHDILRDLCIKIAEKEKFYCVFDTSRSLERERRIVLNQEEMQDVLRSAPLVRSQIIWKHNCHGLFNSKLIRVAIVRDCIDQIENKFRRVNLRFVDGSFELNSSISLFWNLQIVFFRIDEDLARIIEPNEIWEMTQLRHLKCEDFFIPDPPPSDEANDMVLRNLQSLGVVVNLKLSDEVCKRIPNIKELLMRYSNSEEEYFDEALSYYPHNLGRLHKLESLQCSIFEVGPEWHEFAQALTFPSSLKTLRLWVYHLDWEEITMKIGSLPLLEVLELGHIKGGAEWNPVEGGFPRLTDLKINSCHDLTNWNVERSHFPILERLNLNRVPKLDELACDIGEIPTLERIDLSECSEALVISAVRILVEQEDNGNDTIQLHVWFWDDKKLQSFNKIAQEEDLIRNNLHLSLM